MQMGQHLKPERLPLSEEETSQLRALYWNLQEAQNALQMLVNEVGGKRGLEIGPGWAVTQDFRFIQKVER